jgi:hypothetical protein
MGKYSEVFVAFDVAKKKHAVAIAEGGRTGEVRFLSDVENSPLPRRALVEAAWTYRCPARVSDTLRARLEGLPKPVRDIAWKAQVRLCARYRRLRATGKKLPVVIAAIAREMAAFLWAIGREVAPV